jgi:hypothetical protein
MISDIAMQLGMAKSRQGQHVLLSSRRGQNGKYNARQSRLMLQTQSFNCVVASYVHQPRYKSRDAQQG